MNDRLHVFIDANALLTFFSFSNDDLEQLRKLSALIKADKLSLYINEHLSDEFYRNRENKIDESIKKFSKSDEFRGIPRYMHDYPEASDYASTKLKLDKLRNALIDQAKDDAFKRRLGADILFKELLEASTPGKITPQLFDIALGRKLRSNPPGKSDSLGDRLHWEYLLASVPQNTDLHIISKDGDFESDLIKGNAHPYLVDEWKQKNGGILSLHTEIKPFLNSNFANIKLAVDVERKQAINKLVNSGLFSTTHIAISDLSPYLGSINIDECKELLEALKGNTQIKWIASDKDVRGFYNSLLDKFKNDIDSPDFEAAKSILADDDFDNLLDYDESPF